MPLYVRQGGLLVRSGQLSVSENCCCSIACPCPVTLANCTLTVQFVGGTIPSPAPVSPVLLTSFGGGEFVGMCGVVAGQETNRVCPPSSPPPPPCAAGIQAVIACESCCRVADAEGRLPGEPGYVETLSGKNCTITDSTFTPASQSACDNCYEGAYSEVPTDIILTLDCDPDCDNPLP